LPSLRFKRFTVLQNSPRRVISIYVVASENNTHGSGEGDSTGQRDAYPHVLDGTYFGTRSSYLSPLTGRVDNAKDPRIKMYIHIYICTVINKNEIRLCKKQKSFKNHPWRIMITPNCFCIFVIYPITPVRVQYKHTFENPRTR